MAKKPTQPNKKAAHKTHVNKGKPKSKSKVCPHCGYRYTPTPASPSHGWLCPGAY